MGKICEIMVNNNIFVAVHESGVQSVYSQQGRDRYKSFVNFAGDTRGALKFIQGSRASGADGLGPGVSRNQINGALDKIGVTLEGFSTVWEKLDKDILDWRGPIVRKIPVMKGNS